jgi:hypothetical protein
MPNYSIINFNGQELQRIANADFGSRAAARWARDFAADPVVHKMVVSTIGRNLKTMMPRKTGALRKSLRATSIGNRIEWFWLFYGSILSRGIKSAYKIQARDGLSDRPKKVRTFSGGPYKGRTLTMGHARMLRFEPKGSMMPIYRFIVTHPPMKADPFLRAAIRESQIELEEELQEIGKLLFRTIKEVPGYSVDDELDAEIMSGQYGEYTQL